MGTCPTTIHISDRTVPTFVMQVAYSLCVCLENACSACSRAYRSVLNAGGVRVAQRSQLRVERAASIICEASLRPATHAPLTPHQISYFF